MKKSIMFSIAAVSMVAIFAGCTSAKSECSAKSNCPAKAECAKKSCCCTPCECTVRPACNAKTQCKKGKGTCPSKCNIVNNCAWGSWALYLPYETMNACHLILSKDENGKAQAKLLLRWSSPFMEKDVKVAPGSFTLTSDFKKPKGKENDKAAWRARVISGKVSGCKASCKIEEVDGNGKVISSLPFVAKRNPPIGPAPDLSKIVYGEAIDVLAPGMDGLKLMDEKALNGWSMKDGVLSNRLQRKEDGKPKGHHTNIRTKRADFYDFTLTYDVRVLPKCNAGMYLRGIYEIQVLDSYKKPLDCHHMAAFYGRITPSQAAEKPAGEWQKVEVTLWKRHVTVILNGVKIIDNKPVEGITGGAMTPNEFIPGPLYIQGDHSDADFRNVILKPILN